MLYGFLPTQTAPLPPSLIWKASSPFAGSAITAFCEGDAFPILTLFTGVLALKRKPNLLLH